MEVSLEVNFQIYLDDAASASGGGKDENSQEIIAENKVMAADVMVSYVL